jgi:hypothetical protein
MGSMAWAWRIENRKMEELISAFLQTESLFL